MNPRPKLPYKQETKGSSPTTTAGGNLQLVSRFDLLLRSTSPKAAAASFLSGTSPASAGLKSLSSIMPSSSKNKRKNKTKKRPVENVAALYKEDLGTEGLKNTCMSSSSSSTHQDIQSFHVKVDKKEKKKRKHRMERFGEQNQTLKEQGHDPDEDELLGSALRSSRSSSSHSGIFNQEALVRHKKLVGTSTAQEKPYVRLTDYPKAENVRPLKVLKTCLSHIKSKFIQNEDFEWANEQLKSVRQDITVQHLRCAFVLEVYETHARILLEHGDLNEFNQCQTMIRSLTSAQYGETDDELGDSHIVPDDIKLLRQCEETADEFQAYRLLYDLVQHSWSDLGLALSQYATERGFEQNPQNGTYHPELPLVARGSSSRHALKVVKAVIHNDYQTFFRLYESAPHLSAYLMDFLVRRVRDAAFERIISAYRPTVSVEHFREVLVFQDLEETRRFLKKSGAVFVADYTGPAFWVDCKASFAVQNQD